MEDNAEKRKLKTIIFVAHKGKNGIFGKTDRGERCKLPHYAREELNPGDVGKGYIREIKKNHYNHRNDLVLFYVEKIKGN